MINVYKGKKVLVTGHTGFKGGWLSTWLVNMGANVVGVSLDIPSTPSIFEVVNISDFVDDHRVDVRDSEKIKKIIEDVQPDFIFHLAAQALVRKSYESPFETISTNALGTASILDALLTIDKRVTAVIITSDKAYDNVEWKWGYRENDRLGGKDPYSASKGMAELVIRSYFESFFNKSDSNVRLGITRAGNVIGGGDWAADRIVPDCMKAWANKETVNLRNPHATRPWQHVLEPLSGYLALGASLAETDENNGEAFNFGPAASQNYSVGQLIIEMANHWDHVRWNDISQQQDNLYEAGLLKLNCDKALFDLKWQPTLQFEETVKMTVEWYKVFYLDEQSTMREYTVNQINEYTKLAETRNLQWASHD